MIDGVVCAILPRTDRWGTTLTRPLVVTLALAVFLGGCATTTDTVDPVPTATPTPSPTQDVTDPASETPDVVVEWGPDAAPVDLPGGWRVRDCDGDAPLLCVERDGEFVGVLERNDFPVPDDLAAADSDDALVDALRQFADDRNADVAEDRAQGCGQDYVVEPLEVEDLTIGDRPAVRYGFRGIQDGTTTEFVVSYATVVDDTLWIVVADAATDDGCMAAPELDVFDPAVLEAFLPTLDVVAAGTVIP